MNTLLCSLRLRTANQLRSNRFFNLKLCRMTPNIAADGAAATWGTVGYRR